MKSSTKNRILFPINFIYKKNKVLALKILYFIKTKRILNVKSPKSFNEKIQWIKLYDKNALMPKCSDKFHVREYVIKKGYPQILNELLWYGFDPYEIPFSDLPSNFVIKVTHGQGFNIIVKDKSSLDKNEVVNKLNKWLKEEFIISYGEWFYGIEKPRIIIEKFLSEDGTKIPTDYKVMCFNGVPKYIFVYDGRDGIMTRNVYDTDWNFRDVNISYPNAELHNRPEFLDEMLHISSELSNDFKHARIDFYFIEGKIYFGEITFTTAAGFSKLPDNFDLEMGNLLKLH